MIQRAKIEVFGYFLEFGWSDVLHTGYFDCTNNWAIISLMQDHSKLAKMYFWMIQRAKIEVFGYFLEFGRSDVLHTAYFDCTNNWAIISLMQDHSKLAKMYFWMIQRAKIEVLGHFLECGLFYRLDIAYCDCTQCFTTFGKVTRSWEIIQKSRKCIFEWSKEPKKSVLVIFWSLVFWIDLILHIAIVLNVF